MDLANLAPLGRGGPLALPPGITDWLKEYAWRIARKVGHGNGVMRPKREWREERDYKGDTWQNAISEGGEE
jgi:hypothetical protein